MTACSIKQAKQSAFSYAREGGCLVESAGRQQKSSASTSRAVASTSAAVPRRSTPAQQQAAAPAVFPPTKQQSINNNNTTASSSSSRFTNGAAAPTTKGKERARRYEELDVDGSDGYADKSILEDSGFVEGAANTSAKRARAEPSAVIRVRRLARTHIHNRNS
jgi:hypothetical protein